MVQASLEKVPLEAPAESDLLELLHVLEAEAGHHKKEQRGFTPTGLQSEVKDLQIQRPVIWGVQVAWGRFSVDSKNAPTPIRKH